MEIERKWLLKRMPQYDKFFKYDVFQSYLSADTPEVRIRKKIELESIMCPHPESVPSYKMTIKGPGTLSREEIEFSISEDDYEKLRDLIPYRPVHKTYYLCPFEGGQLEISVVDQNWIYAEVEFKSEKEALEWEWPFPECEPVEVTGQERYLMKNYWKHTRVWGSSIRNWFLD